MAKIYRACYSDKTESVSLSKCPCDHRLNNKAYLSAITVTNISRVFTWKMAAKVDWHKYKGRWKRKYWKTQVRKRQVRNSTFHKDGQEAQLSPSDRAMRLVSSNHDNYHATVQKLLIRQVLTNPMVWSWRLSWRQCVINKPTTVELCTSPVYRRLAVAKCF